MGFNLITGKGYSLFEVSSALQKDIRRANERNALFWAYELERSNFGGYLWKRLLIIAMEDIGPADHDAIVRILALKTVYDELRKKKSKDAKLAIVSAVIYLVRCNKSRLYDWAKCCMVNTHDVRALAIPDYALDMHTVRGKCNGKTIDDFFNDGCKVHPHTPVVLEERYMAEARALVCPTSAGGGRDEGMVGGAADGSETDFSMNGQGEFFEP